MSSIALQYTPHEHPPTDVPFELRPFYSKEIWEKRLPAIIRKASRYYKRTLELVWFFIFLACMIGAPIAIFYVALNHLPEDAAEKQEDQDDKNHDDDHDDDFHPFWHDSFDRYWKARLIALASWLAVCLLFYTPMLVWKHHGQKTVNKMLDKWHKEDKASLGKDCPTFKMKHINIISSDIRLEVKLPFAQAAPSSFHPAAYLPAYIVNAPSDPRAAYYYPQTREGPATAPISYSQAENALAAPPQPLSSVSGAIPLFNAYDDRAPGYLAPMGQMPAYGDEKHSFEDVRV